MSRRVGASPALLRVWERRYGLLEPTRAANGYRMYSLDDVRRAGEMQAHLARGFAPAEAAEIAKAKRAGGPSDETAFSASNVLVRLRETLDRFDGAGAERLVDRCVVNFGLATSIRDVLLPYLHDLGARWERGEISVAHEHFASNVVRKRLLALTEGWERGRGRIAVLACAPGEEHDVGLLCFGLCLYSYHGWGVKYFGADTPLADLGRAARLIRPDLVAVSAVTPARFFAELARWKALAEDFSLGIGGAGASARLARRIGAAFLSSDPVTAAARVAEER